MYNTFTFADAQGQQGQQVQQGQQGLQGQQEQHLHVHVQLDAISLSMLSQLPDGICQPELGLRQRICEKMQIDILMIKSCLPGSGLGAPAYAANFQHIGACTRVQDIQC